MLVSCFRLALLRASMPIWQGLGTALSLVGSQCSGICSQSHFHPAAPHTGSLCFPECALGASSALGAVQVNEMGRGGGSPSQRADNLVWLGTLSRKSTNRGANTPWPEEQARGQRLLADGEARATSAAGMGKFRLKSEILVRVQHQSEGADTLRGMITMSTISGAETGRGCVRPTAGAALTGAWVAEVTPEDQVLWVQEFLQQPKKGFISLTILVRGSVTDTKPNLPLGDHPTSPDPKALNGLLVVSAHLTSSSSLPTFIKEFVVVHCGLPVSQVFLKSSWDP